MARLFVRPLVAPLVALLALGGVLGAAALQELDADAPSPAQGHAEVIAHGVAPLPADEVAWRVTRAEAPRPTDLPAQDALGFVLADEDALLLNDLDTGRQARLAAGEAAFASAGVRQQQVPLGDESVAYFQIDLVAAGDADDAGGAERVGERLAPDQLDLPRRPQRARRTEQIHRLQQVGLPLRVLADEEHGTGRQLQLEACVVAEVREGEVPEAHG